ncbi:MAG: peptide chain release factor N(5)-glutamine methyltransferase [Lachnospiraceae bacterium]|nr:peptide chain release factor N(5)-glutamine methyltransferase [Lachnospiraceae bacterium]
MEYRACYEEGCEKLKAVGVPDFETDVRLLLEHVCHTDFHTLLIHGDRPVSNEEYKDFLTLLARREKRIPLQQLLGKQFFCGLAFFVNEHVLIPRQDTEILVEEAAKRLKPGMKLLDMCTGSGCILISLLAMTENVRGVGVDISKEALLVAEQNAGRLLKENQRPDLYSGDLFNALPADTECFDMVISNPPYIPSGEIEELMPEVREYEPREALDGSEDGLLFYRRILEEGSTYLKKEGFILFEIGCKQGEDVKALMESAGFTEVKIVKDYAGLDRVVLGKKG